MSATKTTAEERAAWRDRLRGAYGGVNRHPELPFQSLDEAERCLDDLDSALARNDELAAALMEAEGIINASPAVQQAMGRFHDGLAKRRNVELASENARLTERITKLDAMVQRLGAALVRCSNDFLKLAELDRTIDENENKIETILAQLEARRQKRKPS
jgi:DNA repair exonuclease SbcCD ATPase subunit